MRNKIELDFKISPFKFEYKGLTFIFSTELNLNKFKDRIENYIKQETLKIKYLYGNLNINFDLFLCVSLYKKIEKRGFLIYQGGNIELKENTLFLVAYESKYSNHF